MDQLVLDAASFDVLVSIRELPCTSEFAKTYNSTGSLLLPGADGLGTSSGSFCEVVPHCISGIQGVKAFFSLVLKALIP